MKRTLSVLAALMLCLQGVSALADNAKVTQKNKEQLRNLLATLKVKAAADKKTEHRVSVPTASAGARGAQVRAVDRFAILWPVENISPLTALAMTLTHAAEEGKKWSSLRGQVSQFSESFPEYKGNKVLKDLDMFLKAVK